MDRQRQRDTETVSLHNTLALPDHSMTSRPVHHPPIKWVTDNQPINQSDKSCYFCRYCSIRIKSVPDTLFLQLPYLTILAMHEGGKYSRLTLNSRGTSPRQCPGPASNDRSVPGLDPAFWSKSMMPMFFPNSDTLPTSTLSPPDLALWTESQMVRFRFTFSKHRCSGPNPTPTSGPVPFSLFS